ncbi:MAG: hypothetical protein C00003105_00580 [ANME-2 cluster archaeon HR1]|nr:MAG: hypothetical protein C00003105_00580 [ANME-2 cluster archaeon HR1]
MNTIKSNPLFDNNIPIIITTDKATYLMDPYYWVYDAPDDLWPGYDRSVDFSVMVLDNRGYRVSGAVVDYIVYNNTNQIIANGNHIQEVRKGFYDASFTITDADAGGAGFDGSVPNVFTISVSVNYDSMDFSGITKTFGVGRWGCDRCHLGYDWIDGLNNPIAREIYPWSYFPDGGPEGPHNWKNILGGNGADETTFNISYLTDSTFTHTPSDYLNEYPYHEKTNRKQPWHDNCTPCHIGSGRLRYDSQDTSELPWLVYAKSEVVECTFCHGMDGGYNTTYWPDTPGYAYGEHYKVSPPDGEQKDPYLSRQSCSNALCHGHINSSKPGAIDNAYPTCADCHPISFGSNVPQWMDTTSGDPRDIGGHPYEGNNDKAVVNCSFCHNQFHSLYDGSNVLSCIDCHNQVYEDIDTGYNNYSMNDDPDNLAPGGSSMTHKKDTITSSYCGSDPQGLSGTGSFLYARHANPLSSGGWPGATGSDRNADQVCLNCHARIVRNTGILHEQRWNCTRCESCHEIWINQVILDANDTHYSSNCIECHDIPPVLPDNYSGSDQTQYTNAPNIHYISAPQCTDCHAATLPGSAHVWSMENIPKNYMRTPAIGLMLSESVHKDLVLDTSTNRPTNYPGCLICHTDVGFNIDPDNTKITITDYCGVHTWYSMPVCTKCHSIDNSIIRPGPKACEQPNHEWDNNAQCLTCHNNQNAGRDHGHDVAPGSS